MPVGLLVGTSLLETDFGENFTTETVSTERDPVTVHRTEGLVVVQRHDSPQGYRAPHALHHHSNLLALEKIGVRNVFGVSSTGSLHEDLPPGSVLVPDDFLNPWNCVTFHDDDRGHGVREFSSRLRHAFNEVVASFDADHRTEGTYVQTLGPRFETPAEAQMLADYGDVVGMTAASEVTLAGELGLPYATVCMVDNYVNGIAGTSVDMESFKESVENNVPLVRTLVKKVLRDVFDLDSGGIHEP